MIKNIFKRKKEEDFDANEVISIKTRVVNCQREPYDIYIGRPSKWGNPFSIGTDGNRDDVIKKYEEYVRNSPELLSALPELHGKKLGCWCAPRPCHGDILIKLLKEYHDLD